MGGAICCRVPPGGERKAVAVDPLFRDEVINLMALGDMLGMGLVVMNRKMINTGIGMA